MTVAPRPRPGRAMGLDLGARRIGVAVSDSARSVATPRTTVVRTGDLARDRAELVRLAVEEEVSVVVIGHPLSLDGSQGPAALAAEVESEALRSLLDAHGIEVELFDERLTTVSAHRVLAASGADGRKRRKVVDRTAATFMLSAWLERPDRSR